jgi:hypothetical protein
MIPRLTEQLDVPLRERGLDAPELDSVRAALRQVLTGHEPYPAVVTWPSGVPTYSTSCSAGPADG